MGWLGIFRGMTTKISLLELKTLIKTVVESAINEVDPAHKARVWARVAGALPGDRRAMLDSFKWWVKDWGRLDDEDEKTLRHYPGWEKEDFKDIIKLDIEDRVHKLQVEINAVQDEWEQFRSL